MTPPGTISLAEFAASAPELPLAARHALVEQAQTLLEGLYVHLPLKRAMHGIDPVQRLRLLARRLDGLSAAQFHDELASAFRALGDLHTVYQLPEPYRGHVATLGFLVERCCDADGTPRHVVTKSDVNVPVGAEVTAWSGVPIARAVELGSERQAGSNRDARLARGLEALTLRPLRTGPPPDEHWVEVECRVGGRRRRLRVPWRVTPAQTTAAGAAQDPASALSGVLGIDAGGEAARQVKRALFAPPAARAARPHALRSVVAHATRRVGGRRVGYLRIFSFNVASARRFAEQLAAILARLPQDGLIVDVRGNPGGHVPAAEAALQLLTGRAVDPARFSTATTPLALELCRSNPAFARWRASVDAAVETGELYSQPFPLSDPEALVGALPRYGGPVVLVTDARSYSAADIFAAGFQDNGIGPILGTDRRTGAGGANVWTHDLLRVWLEDSLDALPAGAGFRVALRRVTRVGANVGVPLEDLGVTADAVHALTLRDVTGRNADLVAAAAARLDA